MLIIFHRWPDQNRVASVFNIYYVILMSTPVETLIASIDTTFRLAGISL